MSPYLITGSHLIQPFLALIFGSVRTFTVDIPHMSSPDIDHHVTAWSVEATMLFVHQIVQANNKTDRCGLLVVSEENPPVRGIFTPQRAGVAESVFLSWRHHVWNRLPFLYTGYCFDTGGDIIIPGSQFTSTIILPTDCDAVWNSPYIEGWLLVAINLLGLIYHYISVGMYGDRAPCSKQFTQFEITF